jgi:uncharacterized protein YndB with AHSA1/START domain
LKTVSKETLTDRAIVTTRVFGVPRDRLFNAWADPEYLAQWWGPRGFTNSFEEFDFRPQGAWRFVMHGPDGTNYPNKCVFVEIVRSERIVLRHLEPMHEFQVTADFEALNGATRLTFRMLFDSAEECDKVRGYVIEANEQNFDRLETVLAKMPKPDPD